MTTSLLSCDNSQAFLVDETPGEGIYDHWVSFGGAVFGQIRGDQREPLLAYTVFRCLQFKIINVQKRHFLGWHVLSSYGHILG